MVAMTPPAGASFTDVVVIPPYDDDTGFDEGDPAGDPPVQLLPDLELRHLSPDEVLEYETACSPKHLNFDQPYGGGHRYAFVRHPAPVPWPTRSHGFDHDDVLHVALALSRYIVLNGHCTAIAARRIEDLYPNCPLQIVAVKPGHRFDAWRPLDGTRTFLLQQDAQRLGPLLAMYLKDKDKLLPRIRHAIWLCEQSFRTPYYEVACAQVVSAFDSLIKVGRNNVSLQFRKRVSLLSREVGMTGVTQRRAKVFYGRRSQWVHGKPLGVNVFGSATRELAVMQRVLTSVLRKAVEDGDFRALFTGPNVAKRWPV
jgi:hypothetical protein